MLEFNPKTPPEEKPKEKNAPVFPLDDGYSMFAPINTVTGCSIEKEDLEQNSN